MHFFSCIFKTQDHLPPSYQHKTTGAPIPYTPKLVHSSQSNHFPNQPLHHQPRYGNKSKTGCSFSHSSSQSKVNAAQTSGTNTDKKQQLVLQSLTLPNQCTPLKATISQTSHVHSTTSPAMTTNAKLGAPFLILLHKQKLMLLKPAAPILTKKQQPVLPSRTLLNQCTPLKTNISQASHSTTSPAMTTKANLGAPFRILLTITSY